MYLYLCDSCIFVYLGTYGVESCATLGSSSWQLAELATAVAAEGEAIEASYIAETENPELTRSVCLRYWQQLFLL